MSILYHWTVCSISSPRVNAAYAKSIHHPGFAVRAFVFVLVACAIACWDQGAGNAAREPGGTLVISTTADPGILFPPLIYTTQAKQITEQIFEYLADVGPEMNTRGDKGFRRELSDGWRWSPDSLSIAFHINPRARWHDGHSAVANDVKFTFQLNKNPALAGGALSELSNIDSVTTSDSLTAVFWFHKRSPTQFLDAAAQMLILPAHQLQNISIQNLRDRPPPPIGTGRFRLRRWDKGSSVEIVTDSSNYRGRGSLDRVIWTVSPEFTTAVTKLFSGDADLFDALRAENLRELRKHRNLRVIMLPGTDYTFMQFNLRSPANNAEPHPLFSDRSLRRAIAMSVDRVAIVKSVLDTLASVAIGPTVRAYATTEPALPQLDFDTTRAAQVFDSLGWKRTGEDGMRSKNGRPLAFNLIVPTSSLNRLRMAVLLQAQLHRAGVAVKIEQMDASAFGGRLQAHTFDAALGAFHGGASPDGTRDVWTSAGLGDNGANYGSYANPVFDAQFDSALVASPEGARAAFTRAYTTINEDAPAVWLYEPKTVLGIDRRFRTAEMRPDAWWIDLADWYIPPSERVPRDRLLLSR
jgi:peptide/nickel transport system substrate-binding protein